MRKKKWLRRGAYLLAVLVLLYLIFCWALFNPLEGSMEKLEVLVPKDVVTYVIHTPWAKLRASKLYAKHVAGSRIRDLVLGELRRGDEEGGGLALDDFLLDPLRDIEQQVNEQMPGFMGHFSISEDIAGKEILLAGIFSREGEDLGEKLLNSPFLALTRISFKSRFLEVLHYDFVRRQIPGLTEYRDYFEYDVGEDRIREGAPEEARYFYFARAKDVLILSNDRELIERAVHLAGLARKGGAIEESLPRDYFFYYDVQGPGEKPGYAPQQAGLTAWVRLGKADAQLGGELEEVGREPEGKVKDFVKALFPVTRVSSATLNLAPEDADTLGLDGKIRMGKNSVPRRLEGLHQYQGIPLATSLGAMAKLLPEETTFAFAFLSMGPRDFLLNMLPALDAGTRKLYLSKDPSAGGWTEDRLAEQLGAWFEGGVGMAWARLPDVDSIDLDTYGGGIPLPKPGMTLLLSLKKELEPEELIGFFERNKEKLGFREVSERTAPVGRLFKLSVVVDRSLALFQPAFALVDHQFIYSSNIGELSRILEAANGDRPSLADGPRFTAAMEHASEKGNLFLYTDVVRQRVYLLDQRNEWAREETNFDAVEFRKEKVLELSRERPGLKTRQLQQEADREVELRQRRREDIDFPDAIQRYRQNMFWLWPYEWVVLSANVTGDGAGTYLALRGAVRLREATGE